MSETHQTLIGYSRVSTGHQTLDQQHDALNAAGVVRVFDDVMSGTRSDRPGLAACLDYLRSGDTLVVVALDRLGRSMVDTVNTLDKLRRRGVFVRSLREGIDTSTAAGRMVAGVFASLAELERELIAERAAVAREAARVRGRQTGRPAALNAEQIAVARRMRAAGESPTTIGKTFGISRATTYRILAEKVSAEAHAEGQLTVKVSAP